MLVVTIHIYTTWHVIRFSTEIHTPPPRARAHTHTHTHVQTWSAHTYRRGYQISQVKLGTRAHMNQAPTHASNIHLIHIHVMHAYLMTSRRVSQRVSRGHVFLRHVTTTDVDTNVHMDPPRSPHNKWHAREVRAALCRAIGGDILTSP